MTLTITFKDGTVQTIRPVQSIRVVNLSTIETQTFGNGPVLQRNVKMFAASYIPALDYDAMPERLRDEQGDSYQERSVREWQEIAEGMKQRILELETQLHDAYNRD
jgi:hypothetical protein